jgi:RNA polymerase sigma factor (sigma-70 family)
MSEDSTTRLQSLIDRMNAGDAKARGELIAHACDRLRRLARKMLQDFPRVRSFEETDDIVQNLAIRLMRRLEAVEITTVVEFFRMVAREVRRELIDNSRHYRRAVLPGAAPAPGARKPLSGSGTPLDDSPSDSTNRPDRLASWSEFHERVSTLPDNEQAIFELVWYLEMSQEQAAAVLQISRSAVQRAWLSARLRLGKFLQDMEIT